MSVEITEELVRHVARLARLSLSDAELREQREHFRKVLEYVAQLDEVDTEGVEPSLQAGESLENLRADETADSLPLDEVLKNAPRVSPPFFVVPRIIESVEAGEGSEGSA